MSDAHKQIPYKPLGKKLRTLRERRRESVAEVCDAVEIDEPMLERIESGQERPTEDILLLLLSHFDVQDDYAAELWHMAGYIDPDNEHDHSHDHDQHEAPGQSQRSSSDTRTQTMMVMIDPRVMYADNIEATATQSGVILNFSQTTGRNSQPLTVSRIGMSHEQARAMFGLLHSVLYNVDNPGPAQRLDDGSDVPPQDQTTKHT